MSRPAAVLIADVHYNLQTLRLADAAMRQAITKANELNVPLIVAGDLHDTKANLRGECVNAMVETLLKCQQRPYILVGNHDKINEKSMEHSINFLQLTGARIVNSPETFPDSNILAMIPYQHDPDTIRQLLKQYGPNYKILIMHQGLQGSNMGDYFQDKSAITHNDVKDFRIVSGHYHTRQDIKTGRPQKGAVGLFSYIGNPYTLTYAEAEDPPKGFQVLMDDGTLEFIPTNLRTHRKAVLHVDSNGYYDGISLYHPPNEGDLLWVQVHGTTENLSKVSRASVSKYLGLDKPFKLDSVVTKSETSAPKNTKVKGELLDTLIDSLTNTTDSRKVNLKELWRKLGE